MNTKLTTGIAPNEPIIFNDVPWLNAVPIDYNFLKNKPSSSAWSSYCAIDIDASAWDAADNTYREVNLPSANTLSTATSAITLLVWLGTMTTEYKRTGSLAPVWNVFTVPAGSVCMINMGIQNTFSLLRVNIISGSNKYVRWQSTDLSTTNSEYWFIAVTEVTFNVLFATSSSNRPIFWFMVEIKN